MDNSVGLFFDGAATGTCKRDIIMAKDNDLINGEDGRDEKRVVNEMNFFAHDDHRLHHFKSSHDRQETFRVGNVKKESSSAFDEHGERIKLDINTGLNLSTANTSNERSSNINTGTSSKHVEHKKHDKKIELAVLQADLNKMNVENQRLRGLLNQVNNDYRALEMHFCALTQRQPIGKLAGNIAGREMINGEKVGVARQFMDLGHAGKVDHHVSLSNSSEDATRLREFKIVESMEAQSDDEIVALDDHQMGKGNISERTEREVIPDDHQRADKVARFNNNSKNNNSARDVEQAASQSQTMSMIRRARVSVRARSEASMISDGCQWRKYGQKMAKGNPCPRAYYRCTMASGCPVRKQVQRCPQDQTILTTTYEGNHNHPLPPAAMPMASTTSAAASMLLSGSMPSADGLIMSPNLLAKNNALPFSPSLASLSASAPFPTVTLDLTHSPNPSQFQRPVGQFPFTSPNSLPHNFVPMSHGLGPALIENNYQSNFLGLLSSLGMEYPHNSAQNRIQAASLISDDISAATAAITSDPGFTAALVAAITSMIGNSDQQNQNGNNNSPSTARNSSEKIEQ